MSFSHHSANPIHMNIFYVIEIIVLGVSVVFFQFYWGIIDIEHNDMSYIYHEVITSLVNIHHLV